MLSLSAVLFVPVLFVGKTGALGHLSSDGRGNFLLIFMFEKKLMVSKLVIEFFIGNRSITNTNDCTNSAIFRSQTT